MSKTALTIGILLPLTMGVAHACETKDGRGKANLPDGSRYEGEFKNGLRHGKGRYRRPAGWTYEGEYKNGAQDGYGSLVFPNGDTYEGTFKDQQFSGYCVFKSASGDSYKGELKNGVLNGKERTSAQTEMSTRELLRMAYSTAKGHMWSDPASELPASTAMENLRALG